MLWVTWIGKSVAEDDIRISSSFCSRKITLRDRIAMGRPNGAIDKNKTGKCVAIFPKVGLTVWREDLDDKNR